MIINGPAGSGKSFVLRKIVKMLLYYAGKYPSKFLNKSSTKEQDNGQWRRHVEGSQFAVFVAHQGVAAFKIGGHTICNALSFGHTPNFRFSYEEMRRGASFTALERRFENVS